MYSVLSLFIVILVNDNSTVETGLLAHALLGSIAELYTLIFENAPIMQ